METDTVSPDISYLLASGVHEVRYDYCEYRAIVLYESAPEWGSVGETVAVGFANGLAECYFAVEVVPMELLQELPDDYDFVAIVFAGARPESHVRLSVRIDSFISLNRGPVAIVGVGGFDVVDQVDALIVDLQNEGSWVIDAFTLGGAGFPHWEGEQRAELEVALGRHASEIGYLTAACLVE